MAIPIDIYISRVAFGSQSKIIISIYMLRQIARGQSL